MNEPSKSIPQTSIDMALRARRQSRSTWLRRAAVVLVILAAVLAVAGVVYQVAGAAQDRQSFPPPGQLFDVGGHRLHLYCMGESQPGEPTVILETLSGGISPYWGWVQPELARAVRVCAYDRAGRAWSEPSPQPQSLQQTAQDLHTLLERAGIAGPYVLVGHSIGGLYVRQFAALYSDEVAGLALLDASHPYQFVRHPEWQKQNAGFQAVSSTFPLLARLGLFRLYFATGGEIDFQELPDHQRAEVKAVWSTPRYFASQRDENEAAPAIYTDAQALDGLRDLPLLVVSAGQGFYNGWNELQSELATLSSNSVHLTIEDATHVSLAFNPEHAAQTSAAILRLIEAVQQDASSPAGQQSP